MVQTVIGIAETVPIARYFFKLTKINGLQFMWVMSLIMQ